MTLRIIVRTDDCGMAANVGGPVHSHFRTFDVEAPEIEAYLRERRPSGYVYRQVTGVEVFPAEEGER